MAGIYADTYADTYGDTMTVTLGVDVSSHQGAIDWAAVGRTPFRFALCRMTIGQNTRDTTSRTNLRGILDHVAIPGAYGVVGLAEPVEQGARFLLDEIATVTDPAGVLVMLDAEDFGDGSHPTIDQVDRYARTLQADLGRWPVAYVPGWWMGKYGYTAAGRALAECPWAPSHYLSSPWTETRLLDNKPALELGFKRLGWLQYTDRATVAGIAGGVDANVFYGTQAEMRSQLLGQEGDPVSATGPEHWDDADWKAWDDKRLIRLGQLIAGKTNQVFNATSLGIAAPATGDVVRGLGTSLDAILNRLDQGLTVHLDLASASPEQLDQLAALIAGHMAIKGPSYAGTITLEPQAT